MLIIPYISDAVICIQTIYSITVKSNRVISVEHYFVFVARHSPSACRDQCPITMSSNKSGAIGNENDRYTDFTQYTVDRPSAHFWRLCAETQTVR